MAGCHPSELKEPYVFTNENLDHLFQTQYEWNNHTKNRIDSIKAGVQMLLNDVKELNQRLVELENNPRTVITLPSKVSIGDKFTIESPLQENIRRAVDGELVLTLQREIDQLKLENEILGRQHAKKNELISKLHDDIELMTYRLNEANNNQSGPTL